MKRILQSAKCSEFLDKRLSTANMFILTKRVQEAKLNILHLVYRDCFLAYS